VILNILLNPLNIDLRFRARHLALWQFRALAARQQRLGDLAPVAVHHVRLVEFDLEEEGRAGGVRRRRVGGRRADGSAHDEALERLAVPLPASTDLLRERLDFLHGGKFERWCRDESPLARERVEYGGWLSSEVTRAVVDAVEVQAGLVGGVREYVFFETVVAELQGIKMSRRLEFPRRLGRTSAATVQPFIHSVSASCSVVFPACSK
jgi:hypothetical protein